MISNSPEASEREQAELTEMPVPVLALEPGWLPLDREKMTLRDEEREEPGWRSTSESS